MPVSVGLTFWLVIPTVVGWCAVHASELPADKPIPPVKTAGPLAVSNIPARALQQIRAGLARARQHANDAPRDKLPPAAQRMRTWALGQVSHVVAAQNPFELEELAALRAQRRQSEPVLGEMPLTVITRGLPEETGPDGAALESEHRADHARIATLSARGKLIVAEHSRHHVQLDEPTLVIAAIQEVLASVSK